MGVRFFCFSKFDIRVKVISEESIEVNGLNETFTYNSGNRAIPPNYTLIYIDSENYILDKSLLKIPEKHLKQGIHLFPLIIISGKLQSKN